MFFQQGGYSTEGVKIIWGVFSARGLFYRGYQNYMGCLFSKGLFYRGCQNYMGVFLAKGYSTDSVKIQCMGCLLCVCQNYNGLSFQQGGLFYRLSKSVIWGVSARGLFYRCLFSKGGYSTDSQV